MSLPLAAYLGSLSRFTHPLTDQQVQCMVSDSHGICSSGDLSGRIPVARAISLRPAGARAISPRPATEPSAARTRTRRHVHKPPLSPWARHDGCGRIGDVQIPRGGINGKAPRVEYERRYPARDIEPERQEGATGPDRPKRKRVDGMACYANSGEGMKRRCDATGGPPGRPPG